MKQVFDKQVKRCVVIGALTTKDDCPFAEPYKFGNVGASCVIAERAFEHGKEDEIVNHKREKTYEGDFPDWCPFEDIEIGAFPRGKLKVIYGCMKSGKSLKLIQDFTSLQYTNKEGIIFLPEVETRTKDIYTAFFDLTLPSVKIRKAEDCYPFITSDLGVIAFDETQFFDESIVTVIKDLRDGGYHVIVSGLNLDFRGEPFGSMGELIKLADKKIYLAEEAICADPSCNNWATMTQRLISGKPASYDDPLVLIEGSNQKSEYKPVCKNHHIIGKPKRLR